MSCLRFIIAPVSITPLDHTLLLISVHKCVACKERKVTVLTGSPEPVTKSREVRRYIMGRKGV